jgi:hypothetical protein
MNPDLRCADFVNPESANLYIPGPIDPIESKFADFDFFGNRRGFGRASNKTPNPPKQGNGTSPTTYGSPSLTPSSSSNLATSPVMTPTSNIDNPRNNQENFNQNQQQVVVASRKPPFFFREQYANLIVKGNFMTLAARPVLVEEGEWLAHQGM